MLAVIFIFISYLLGSIPFGYIFSKISGKEILKIGWRKTSGSNVFRNVGAWQGLATGLGDMGKGFLAVWLAQNFAPHQNLVGGQLLQALSGVAAVTGHNWSCFIKLAGGRGIGTFIGAFLALNPQLLGLSIIPFAILALIWNASIGTILFLATSLILSIYPPPFLVGGQFETIGILTSVSLLPIFIKRLSPIGELSLNPPKFSEKFGRVKKKEIIRNRLLFDDDIPRFDLRIVRIIKRLTKS